MIRLRRRIPDNMTGLIIAIHLIVCVFMIIVILLQAGKGANIGATFGGGGSQTLFGPRGAATFLSKVTTVSAIIFLGTSIYLANVSKNKISSSVLQGMSLPPKALETAPAETQPETQGITKGAETAPKVPKTKPK